jgi:hypothetical protein
MGYEKALSLLRRGRANPSDYLVQLPQAMTRFAPSNDFGDYISYFTRATTLPSSQNTLLGVTGHENVGIKRNMVTGRNYGAPIVLTFTERSDLLIYQTLKNWIDSTIVNSEQMGGVGDGNRSLRVQYYNSVKSDVYIYKLEPMQQGSSGVGSEYTGSFSTDSGPMRGHVATGKWTFINAIPTSIEQTTVSIEAADSLLDFTTSISYESYKFEPFVGGLDLGSVITYNNRS